MIVSPALDLEALRDDKRMLVILETDGCYADGVEVATGATIGHRTLRVVDYGKVATTFVDVKTGTAVRVAPRPDVRQRTIFYAPRGMAPLLRLAQRQPGDTG